MSRSSSLKSVQRASYGGASEREGSVGDIDPGLQTERSEQAEVGSFYLNRGRKVYELKNHPSTLLRTCLGNVLAVVSDVKLGVSTSAVVDYYTADVVEMTDYEPFGMQLAQRHWVSGSGYWFGFQGQEGDDEWSGEGNMLVYKYRVHDVRLGRFLSVDPPASTYPWNSAYAFAENRVIRAIELEGAETAEPKGFFESTYSYFFGDFHVVRAYQFAAEHGIDEGNIYIFNLPSGQIKTATGKYEPDGGDYWQRRSVIICHSVCNKITGEEIEYNHVFRQCKPGEYYLLTSSANDDLWQEWYNYWDDEGLPIFTQFDLSENLAEAPGPFGGGAKSGKVPQGISTLGSASRLARAYIVYTFMTRTERYYGMTIDFAKRMAQHGSRIVGTPLSMIKNFPDRITARGIEQLFIEYRRITKNITNQINSIKPKGVERFMAGIEKGTKFLKDNYPGQFDYVIDAVGKAGKI